MNSNLTKEILLGIGLQQGGHLTPFLFLVVTKGLKGLVREVVNIGNYKGVSMGNG